MKTCENICLKIIDMLEKAGENMSSDLHADSGRLIQSKICSNIKDGINHNELLRRLDKFKLVIK